VTYTDPNLLIEMTDMLMLPHIVTCRNHVPFAVLASLSELCDAVKALPGLSRFNIRVITSVTSCCTCLHTIGWTTAHEELLQTLIGAYATQLLRVLNRTITAVTNIAEASHEAELKLHVQYAGESMHACVAQLVKDGISGRLRYAMTTLPAGSMWERLLQAIPQLNRSQQCSAPDCERAFADAWPFKRCSGHSCVIYCSRRCQMAAWAHPAVSYRAVCGMSARPMGLTESSVSLARHCSRQRDVTSVWPTPSWSTLPLRHDTSLQNSIRVCGAHCVLHALIYAFCSNVSGIHSRPGGLRGRRGVDKNPRHAVASLCAISERGILYYGVSPQGRMH
jgi:hypothetical protein